MSVGVCEVWERAQEHIKHSKAHYKAECKCQNNFHENKIKVKIVTGGNYKE